MSYSRFLIFDRVHILIRILVQLIDVNLLLTLLLIYIKSNYLYYMKIFYSTNKAILLKVIQLPLFTRIIFINYKGTDNDYLFNIKAYIQYPLVSLNK